MEPIREIEFDKHHKIIYDRIKYAMYTTGRRQAEKRYNGSDAATLKYKWEGFHLREFAKSIRPSDQEGRGHFDDILEKHDIDGFEALRDMPNEKKVGIQLETSDAAFKGIAEFLAVPLLVCFLRFLEFCRVGTDKSGGPLPLSVFDDKGIVSITLDELIVDIKKHIEVQKQKFEKEESQNEIPIILPSPNQPHLTVPESKEGNPNYYANALLDVIGRNKEKKRLEDFLNCDMNVAWLQLAGVAGQGKSRLAFDLVKSAIDDLGWSAGFLEENGILRFKDKWFTWQPDRPHLIVFDYVVGREDVIKPILQTLTSRREEEYLPSIRILLVERQPWDASLSFHAEIKSQKHASNTHFTQPRDTDSEWYINPYKDSNNNGNSPTGLGYYINTQKEYRPTQAQESRAEWYNNLCRDSCYDGNDSNLMGSCFDTGVVELEKLGEDDLVEIVKQIFEKECGNKCLVQDSKIKEALRHIDKSGRPLYAYFLGQELAHGENISAWSNCDLLISVLSRERKRWWAAAFKDRNKPPRVEDDFPASRLAVLATMIDGLDIGEASVKKHIPVATAEDREQAQALTGNPMSEGSDGSPPMYIPPMQPDLLGEWYVISSFDKEGPPLKELTAIAWHCAPEKMGSFLQKLHQDFGNHSVPNTILESLDIEQIDIKALTKVAYYLISRFRKDGSAIPGKAMQALSADADSGNFRSMYLLGLCYSDGTGMEKEIHKAAEWYRKAANKGSSKAMVSIGFYYQYQAGTEKNVEVAFNWYRKAAEMGNITGLCNVGICFEHGHGVKKDNLKAVQYYQESAKSGHTTAMTQLAFCYREGKGLEKDIRKAFEWFEKAASLGDIQAMNQVAIIYMEGEGVEKDAKKAMEWFLKAADAGSTDAMANIGTLYSHDTGAEKNLEKAIEWYQKAAKLGHSYSMRKLAYYYRDGYGVEKNIQKCIHWYQKAAESGDIGAIHDLGLIYYDDNLVKQDIKKARYWLEKSAELGSPDNMCRLGIMYNNGIGVNRDVTKAYSWFSKAAKKGDSQAMGHLAYCYLDGSGVEKDNKSAIEWYRKAANAGNQNAMIYLATRHISGEEGVDKDYIAAIHWLEKAAECGHSAAMYQLYRCYVHGIGLEKDISKAIQWLYKAAEAGSDSAMLQLAFRYKNGEDFEMDTLKAVEWLQKASKAGNTEATVYLGICYENGDGIEKDINKAAHCYKKAADAGNTNAMYYLGICYENGDGIEKDKLKAIGFYRMAAESGNVDAMNALGACYQNGSIVNQDIQVAIDWYQKAAKSNHVKAMNILGFIYQKGTGIEKDTNKAVEWFKRAADAGYEVAMFNLGVCYQYGNGIEQCNHKAVNYYKMANSAGYKEAKTPLVILLLSMNLLNEIDDGHELDAIWANNQVKSISTDHWSDKPLAIGVWEVPSHDHGIQILTYFHRAFRTAGILDKLDNLTCCHLRYAPLTFYPKYFLADIEFTYAGNKETQICSAIVGAKGVVPLNGDYNIIYILNMKLLSFTTEGAIYDYLRFYFEFVHDSKGPFKIVSTWDDIPIEDKVLRFIFRLMKKLLTIKPDKSEFGMDGWRRFRAYFLYADKMYVSAFKLFPDGSVKIGFKKKIMSSIDISRRKYSGIFRSKLFRS